MDKASCGSSDKDSSERMNANSEWLPTKCRITKPPPPKPAANPLQFVKVAPNALVQKAQEQVKKVEGLKTQRHTVKEDAEEWQQNLDNWKSSRRKRQEHIIERVVEVKKLEQEGYDRSRRKSKTFNEILEDRNKRGHRLNIAIFDDDSNDLSDYGIGSSSSKTNSVKDIDTDDSSSYLDDNDQGIRPSNSQTVKDASSASNQSQSEDELLSSTNRLIDKENSCKPNSYNETDNYPTIRTNILSKQNPADSQFHTFTKREEFLENSTCLKEMENKADDCYTYQRAIEEYRSKVLPTTKPNESEDGISYNIIFDKVSPRPVAHIEKCPPKHLLTLPSKVTVVEFDKSKRLLEDFANSLSVKERLKNLQKFSDLQIKTVEKNTPGNAVKTIIESLTKQGENDIKNNNFVSSKTGDSKLPNRLEKIDDITEPASPFLIDNPLNMCQNISNEFYRSSSPEVDAYMNKLNQMNQDLDCDLSKSHSPQSSLSECSGNTTAPPSVSSTELLGLSSDSGIHTADVSCSVSQADESVEYNDILSSTIPNCIEKLQKERERKLTQQVEYKLCSELRENIEDNIEVEETRYVQPFLSKDSKENCCKIAPMHKDEISDFPFPSNKTQGIIQRDSHGKSIIYGNENVKMYNGFLDTALVTSTFPLAPPTTKEPPKEKPPPPPVEEDEIMKQTTTEVLNSTKRIMKEMHIKRSSFLGLDEPISGIESEISIDTPPDVNIFLQRESRLEKSLYRKYHDSRENSSEVESQDSGLGIERGCLSNDAHGREDNEDML